MAIDLSKLKALELPTKEITAEVLGEPQKITITAYGDDIALNIGNITEAHPDDVDFRVWVMLLQVCAGMSEEDATLYVSRDMRGAASVVKEVYALTNAFSKARSETRAQAKKKLNQDASPQKSN